MKIKIVLAFACGVVFTACEKTETLQSKTANLSENNATVASTVTTNATASVQWKVDARCFLDGPSGLFDDIAVKDPSIVYSGGFQNLFYTGRNGSSWSLGYAKASTVAGLKTATHTKLSSIGSGGGLAAPQIFWFPRKGKWFLIYQNGRTASFSTNTSVSSPSGWTPIRSMGFSDGIDYWCISDGTYVYCFYSAQDGTHTIKRRRTTVANFPYSWGSPTVVATSTFEAVHVYKSKSDSKYYMVVEDLGRYQELWTASSLGGTWTKVAEKWASKDNLTYLADHWTDQVSHVELLRSGIDEKMEINNIDHCDMLIQGVISGDYGGYANTPYDLGLIHNY